MSTILVMGDSLSAAHGISPQEGWVNLLRNRLKDQQLPYEVINLSTSGDTSSNGLSKLPAALQQYKPAIVIIALGSNDGLRGLSVVALENNLSRMIALSKYANAKVLLLGAMIPLNYGPVYREKFEKVFTELASTHHVPLLPFLLENVALKPELMQDDGFHPTAAAQPIILENVWPYLLKVLNTK